MNLETAKKMQRRHIMRLESIYDEMSSDVGQFSEKDLRLLRNGLIAIRAIDRIEATVGLKGSNKKEYVPLKNTFLLMSYEANKRRSGASSNKRKLKQFIYKYKPLCYQEHPSMTR